MQIQSYTLSPVRELSPILTCKMFWDTTARIVFLYSFTFWHFLRGSILTYPYYLSIKHHEKQEIFYNDKWFYVLLYNFHLNLKFPYVDSQRNYSLQSISTYCHQDYVCYYVTVSRSLSKDLSGYIDFLSNMNILISITDI